MIHSRRGRSGAARGGELDRVEESRALPFSWAGGGGHRAARGSVPSLSYSSTRGVPRLGEYDAVVNLDKQQYLDSSTLGLSAKLSGLLAGPAILTWLLSDGAARPGGPASR